MKLPLAAALTALAAPAAWSTPLISEFMADNAGGLTDGAGRHSDWIEINNASAVAQDMAGWHLSDNAANKKKWTFPAITIAPGGRLVVFASGDGVPESQACQNHRPD